MIPVIRNSEGRQRVWLQAVLLMVCGVFLIVLSLFVFGEARGIRPAPAPTATSWPLEGEVDSPGYGINVHMWWDPWAAVRRDWPLIKDAGFSWVKQRVAWRDVEGAGPGIYEWAHLDRIVDEAGQAALSLILRVDYPPYWAHRAASEEGPYLPVSPDAFGNFCSALASRYRGRVRGYQVWNEPNLAREWNGYAPNPEGYVQLLRHCYAAIKAADSQALIISAGLAPTGSSLPEAIPDTQYLVAMYEAGASPYFDLLGLNAPGYKAPPEMAPEVVADPDLGYGGQAFFCFRHVEQMRAIMEDHGDAHKQVALLEFGWHTNASPDHPEYAWFAVTPEEQASYLVRAFEYARQHWSPWIGPMFVWNLPDSQWTPQDEEFWWGVVDPFWWGSAGDPSGWGGGELRPAYEALKEMEKP